MLNTLGKSWEKRRRKRFSIHRWGMCFLPPIGKICSYTPLFVLQFWGCSLTAFVFSRPSQIRVNMDLSSDLLGTDQALNSYHRQQTSQAEVATQHNLNTKSQKVHLTRIKSPHGYMNLSVCPTVRNSKLGWMLCNLISLILLCFIFFIQSNQFNNKRVSRWSPFLGSFWTATKWEI